MKLIPMTDLVLQGYNINQINNYAKFLKQPLKLEMFVPCDDDGNPLDEFEYLVDIYKHNDWFKAKEKVLFEGFKYCEKSNTVRNQVFIFSEQTIKELTIEDLVKYYLTLTESAINKLGL